MIIVPVSDIVLMEEKREHLRQIDVRGEVSGRSALAPAPAPETPEPRHRSLCLICGKSEKTPGTGSFYKILEETIDCYGGRGDTIVKKLTDILGFNFESKRKVLASLEICKKCLRTTTEVVRMEEQLKRSKEELISNFFTTTAKFRKNHGSSQNDCHRSSPPPAVTSAPPPLPQPTAYKPYPTNALPPTGFAFPPGSHQNGFLVQPIPFLNDPSKHIPYGNGIVQFYPHQPYSTIRHSRDERMRVPPEMDSKQETKSSEGGSEATPSEVGSSCYMTVSPTPKSSKHRDDETDSISMARPFDTESYASTFSFRSCSSIRSKAEIKSYDEPISLEIEKNDGDKVAEKRKCESNDTSPRSQTSPVSTTSPKPDSLGSNSNSPSRSPDLEKTETDLGKHWKKRKLASESGSGSAGESQGEKSPEVVVKEEKTPEVDSSPDCQQQVDNSLGSSDNN